MSKKMTPCERLGYKVGDKFKASKSGAWFNVGEEVELGMDDGSNYPYFFNARMPKDSDGGWPRHIESVEKISNAKLKPAKQALADAIHQNGGWRGGKYAVYGKHSGKCSFLTCKPQYLPKDHGWFVMLSWIAGEFAMKPFANWHQTILSRDEYLTAYPEQVKVEVRNETQHEVEVEMESESEVTINVGDWHKKGELPPVGEFCEWIGNWGDGEYRDCLDSGVVVKILAHYQPIKDGNFVAVFAYETKEPIGMLTDQSIAKCFRPLRTERDKAIDDMVNVMSATKRANYEITAAALYDAGYRKEVK